MDMSIYNPGLTNFPLASISSTDSEDGKWFQGVMAAMWRPEMITSRGSNSRVWRERICTKRIIREEGAVPRAMRRRLKSSAAVIERCEAVALEGRIGGAFDRIEFAMMVT